MFLWGLDLEAAERFLSSIIISAHNFINPKASPYRYENKYKNKNKNKNKSINKNINIDINKENNQNGWEKNYDTVKFIG